MHPVAAHPRFIAAQNFATSSAGLVRSQITSLFRFGRKRSCISPDRDRENEVSGFPLTVDYYIRKLERQFKTPQSKMTHSAVLRISAARTDNFTEVVNLPARIPVRRVVFREQTIFVIRLSLIQSARERSNIINPPPVPKSAQELIVSTHAIHGVSRDAVHIEQRQLEENSWSRGIYSDSCCKLLQERPL